MSLKLIAIEPVGIENEVVGEFVHYAKYIKEAVGKGAGTYQLDSRDGTLPDKSRFFAYEAFMEGFDSDTVYLIFAIPKGTENAMEFMQMHVGAALDLLGGEEPEMVDIYEKGCCVKLTGISSEKFREVLFDNKPTLH